MAMARNSKCKVELEELKKDLKELEKLNKEAEEVINKNKKLLLCL